MKYIKMLIISSLLIFMTPSFVFAAVKESCTTGTYSALYPLYCDTCGYSENRLYQGTTRDYWDYFNPTDTSIEYMFSTFGTDGGKAKVVDFGTYLNDETVAWSFDSNFSPINVGIDKLILYSVYDVALTSLPATRDTPVGRIEYYAKFWNVKSDGDTSVSLPWAYNLGSETAGVLTKTPISGGSGVKTVDNPSGKQFHNECYIILPAWCGDGTVDSSEGESCDPADAAKAGWGTGGCSATCQPLTTTTSSSSSSSSGGGGTGSSSSGGGSTSSSSGGGSNSCGDGTIQRPNGAGVFEECEADVNGVFPNYCTSCRYNTSFPTEGGLYFGAGENVIIGDGMNPYTTYNLPLPSVLNTGTTPLYVENLCVYPEATNNALVGGEVCEYKNAILAPNQYTTMTSTPSFVGSTSKITSVSKGFEDNMLRISMKNNGTSYDTAYFASQMQVRVAKPTVATAGGGTSFLRSTDDLSDVNKVADNGDSSIVANNVKNFVGAGISAGDISSYSKDVTDADSIINTQSTGTNYNSDLSTVTDNAGGSINTTTNLNDFASYNGLDNVYILQNGDFRVLSTTFNGTITGTRTYIIENGDLTIDGNIIFPDNIAFVVKGGNIEINKDVTRIDGTYITIVSGTAGGKFMGTGGKTFTNVLTVNGSFYGDLAHLLSQRTYVKSNSNGQLDVGTIVNFGSDVFKKPAPLVGKFIADYLDSIRVAK